MWLISEGRITYRWITVLWVLKKKKKKKKKGHIFKRYNPGRWNKIHLNAERVGNLYLNFDSFTFYEKNPVAFFHTRKERGGGEGDKERGRAGKERVERDGEGEGGERELLLAD